MSFPSLVLGKSRAMSIAISIHGSIGIYMGVYKPCDYSRYFACLQVYSKRVHILDILDLLFRVMVK
ncbi:hypothetical protein MA16_Dca001873 [Dendrobium catenatum]|uniref:Uncharacterized protein n=1 Tax=Dendrobium catenatum TaxID=906689 RepID=A0A2I0XDQ9_9ASPA|nr:hypothetical protein MA16_Dca001873 [Dendrobium catenatum]